MTKKKKISLCLSLPELIELNDLLSSVPRSQKEIELFESLPVESAPLLKTMRVAGSALSQYESEDDSFYFIFSQLTYIFSRFKYSLSIGIKSNDSFILECLQHHPVLFDEYLKALVQSGEVKEDLFKSRSNTNKVSENEVVNQNFKDQETQTEFINTSVSTQTDCTTTEISVQVDFNCTERKPIQEIAVQANLPLDCKSLQEIAVQTDLPLDFACQVELLPSKPIRRIAVKKKKNVSRVLAPQKGQLKEQNVCLSTKMSYSAALRQQATENEHQIASPSVAKIADSRIPDSDLGPQTLWRRRFKTVVKKFVTKIVDDDGFITFVKKKIKVDKPYYYKKRPQ